MVSGREQVDTSATSILGMERPGLLVSAMGKVFSIHTCDQTYFKDPAAPNAALACRFERHYGIRFPRFSQGLAQDPTTCRIWFGIRTAHDFESLDDINEERLYQNIFSSHFGQLAIIFLWTSGNLFNVPWQGNFKAWVYDPLHWWYTISLRTNEDPYTGALFLLLLSTTSLIAGPGDFLVHHDIALGLHTTILILVKGTLDARGSKLMLNKKDFGYRFSSDDPERGGTYDISA
ncbi:hypothetical protein Ddye_021737 [Dipteronia dyeriana]|uniref:Uncharacterized protein n=1 Tax=Dipteronia dyeriana TaxID=168575 RepID=A0AAD9U2R6_9ROSI|nr:hypothetical protein Ddye_021737 [Dipteronia dyeriana]